jgi:hypothetical protein
MERAERFEEALSVIKQCLTQERVQFSGKHYTITEMPSIPASKEQPHPPILIGCAGKRMLSLAAREADCISIMFRLPPLGPDQPNAALEQQLAWVHEAAGERFAQIELCQLAYALSIKDGRVDRDFEGEGPPIPRIVMRVEQAVEHLLEQRERYGFSYIPVYGGTQMEQFAPVVARLAGT